MTKTDVRYSLERGMMSIRKGDTTGGILWQLYDYFDSLPEAKSEAGRVSPGHPKTSYWRVVRSEVVWLKEPE